MNLECKEIPNGFLVELSYISQKISTKYFRFTDNVTDNVTDNQKIIFEMSSLIGTDLNI